MDDEVLLDTHIWIWLATGSSQLSRKTAARLEETASQHPLLIPTICIWELAMLEKASKIQLPLPVDQWISKCFSEWRVHTVDLSWEIVLESVLLPGSFHSDPADRMIVATARILKLPLVTCDANIIKYAKAGHLSVIRG